MDAELRLDKEVTCARQSEQIKKQQELMKTNFKLDVGANMDHVQLHQKPYAKTLEKMCTQAKKKTYFSKKLPTLEKDNACHRCGRAPAHVKQQCLARDKISNKSHKKGHIGHFARVCRNKRVNAEIMSEAPTDEVDTAFLGLINSDSTEN